MENPKGENSEPKEKKSIIEEGNKIIETRIKTEGNKTTTHIITTNKDETYDKYNAIDLSPNEYYLDSKNDSDLIDFPISELILESERFENGQNKKSEFYKKGEIEEIENKIKEEEEKKIRRKNYEINEDLIEKNSILYDSNSHYSSEYGEKNITERSSINININDKYSPYDYSEEIRNASNGGNEISKEELFNLKVKLIQSVFRGYILRKVFYTNMQVYLDYSWAFSLIESIIHQKLIKSFFYLFKFYVFQKKKKFMKNILNINAKKLPKIFIQKRFAILTNLKEERNDYFTIKARRKKNRENIKIENEKKEIDIESRNLNIINEELKTEIRKLKKRNEKLKEENESLKVRSEYIIEDSKEIINTYRNIKIKYIFKDYEGKIINEKNEIVLEQPSNLISIFKKFEKELKEANNYIKKLKEENLKFDDKISKIISDIEFIIKKQNEITKRNKNEKEIEIENKLNLISENLNEISINKNEMENLKNEIEKLKKLLEEEKNKNNNNNPLSGSNFTFGKTSEEDLEKKLDNFLLKSKSFSNEQIKLIESKDINNESISFKNIYSLLQDSKDKLENNKNEIYILKTENENLKNNLKESFDLTKNENNEKEIFKNIIEEKNKEIEKLREQIKKALQISDNIQKNKLLKEIEQEEKNKLKEERKLLKEISSNRKKIPFEEINELKKENMKLKEEINNLQNEINLLNQRNKLKTKEDNNNLLQKEINNLRQSNQNLKNELNQEKEFSDKFKKEKKILHNKMRETFLRQLLLNYMRKEEKTLSYNFTRFVKIIFEMSEKKKGKKLSKEKLKEILLKNIIENKEKEKLYFLRKNFMKFYRKGIIKEMNMSNSQKKNLEKRRSDWKIKYEKEKLAEKLEKENPEKAKKIREEIKLIEEQEKKNNLNTSIISPNLTDEEKRELAKKKYLKDLFYNKIKVKQNFIHKKFTKFYYRGLYLRMKYGEKLKDKLQIPENKKEEKKEKEEKKKMKI